MSYDDGRTADRRLVSIFNEYGIRGTFHLNSGFLGGNDHVSAEEVKILYAGHEVSCHTVTHPTIARCPRSEVAQEILDDRRALESLTGYPVRGLSYPNGSLSDEIVSLLPGLGIRYSRTVISTQSFALPEDPLRWAATCHHNRGLMELGEQFLGLYKKQYLYLMYVWGHSYEFDAQDNCDLIEGFCRRMCGHEDIWYCTNIEYVDYMDGYKCLRFAADNSFVENPNAQDYYISVNDAPAVCLKAGQITKL